MGRKRYSGPWSSRHEQAPHLSWHHRLRTKVRLRRSPRGGFNGNSELPHKVCCPLEISELFLGPICAIASHIGQVHDIVTHWGLAVVSSLQPRSEPNIPPVNNLVVLYRDRAWSRVCAGETARRLMDTDVCCLLYSLGVNAQGSGWEQIERRGANQMRRVIAAVPLRLYVTAHPP